MATRPATAPEAMPSTLGLPWAIHSENIQAERRGGGGDLGHGHGHAGAIVGRDRAAGVEAEPADPQHGGADHGVAQVMRRHGGGRIALALAEHRGRHQTGDTGIDVHHGAAGEIQHAPVPHQSQPPPHTHVRDREHRPASATGP